MSNKDTLNNLITRLSNVDTTVDGLPARGLIAEMCGFTKMAIDKFTPSSDITVCGRVQGHTLGDIPQMFILAGNVGKNLDGYIIELVGLTSPSGAWHGAQRASSTSISGGYSASYVAGSSSYKCTASDITLNTNGNSTTYKLKAGVEYTLATFA